MDLEKIIDEALRKRSLSASAASKAAVGNPSLIKNIKLGKQPAWENVIKLAQVLGLEFYLGPPRGIEHPVGAFEDTEPYATIGHSEQLASAGVGAAADVTIEPVRLAFREQWLRTRGINPARASILRVRGESMAPTLRDGNLILIDEQDLELRERRIFVYERAGDILVKRLSLVPGIGILIEADNEAPEFAPDLVPAAEADIIRPLGRVIWSCGDVR